MDSKQLNYLVSHDFYLKKYSCSIISDFEIPLTLPLNEFFFILTSIRKKRGLKDQNFEYIGHWILIDTLEAKNKKNPNQITYFDPYGSSIQSLKIKRCLKRTIQRYSAILHINSQNYQHKHSTICGGIVAYVSLLRSRGFSLKVIQEKKLSKNLFFNVRFIPEFISYFLSPKNNKIKRFSLDFL